MPHVWPLGGGSGGGTPIPGQILQTVANDGPASDFNFNSSSFSVSNFPANPNWTKISSTSFLLVIVNSDFQPGTAPDVIRCFFTIDGNNIEGWNVHVSVTNFIGTIVGHKIQGLNPLIDPPLASGPHTYGLNVATAHSQNCTLLTSAATDIEIIEYAPL